MPQTATLARPPPANFETLIASYQAPLFRFLFRLCLGHRLDAEDLCQETFLRAYRAFSTLDEGANYRAWLYRIAYNAYLNNRRARRHVLVELDEEIAGRPEEHDGRELARAVGAFIAELPPKQRAALILRRVDGREYAEVARVLACSEDAARASVFQALKKLRERFGEEYEAL